MSHLGASIVEAREIVGLGVCTQASPSCVTRAPYLRRQRVRGYQRGYGWRAALRARAPVEEV